MGYGKTRFQDIYIVCIITITLCRVVRKGGNNFGANDNPTHWHIYCANKYRYLWWYVIIIIWLWYDVMWCVVMWCDDVMWCDVVWWDVIWYDMIYDMVWYDMIWQQKLILGKHRVTDYDATNWVYIHWSRHDIEIISWEAFCAYDLTFIPTWVSNNIIITCGMKLSSIYGLQRLHRWRSGMDK